MAFWKRRQRRPDPVPRPAPATADAPPEFPYPLVTVPGTSAVQEWQRLRELWRPEGHCPVVLGDREQVEVANEAHGACDLTSERILEAAKGRAAEAFLGRRLAEVAVLGGIPVGAWPDPPPPAHELSGHCDLLSGKPWPLVYLAKIPTARPYEIPAFLKFGGWNECPSPEDQVVVHRHWYERFGAEIYAIAGDVVECWVANPPEDRQGAEALAHEQYLYCNDLVDQGTQTVLALAAALKGSRAWFFWWD